MIKVFIEKINTILFIIKNIEKSYLILKLLEHIWYFFMVASAFFK